MGSTKDPAYKVTYKQDPQAPQETLTYNKNRALAPDQKLENMYFKLKSVFKNNFLYFPACF